MNVKRTIDTAGVDLEALQAISARSIPRKWLQAQRYRSMLMSSDLFRVGYRVRHWLKLGESGNEVLEYLPRMSDLPRLTATCYDEQAEIHRALRLNLVAPGERWSDYQQPGLFDELLSNNEGEETHD